MSKKTTYSKEFKESVLKRLEPPTKDTPTSLSRELNIPRTTIYQWIRKNNENNKNLNNNKPASKWTSEDKFYAVLETSTFTEVELAEYCRKKGIYVSELKEWKDQCIDANKGITEDPQELKTSLKEEKEKNKELEKELRYKEKALAETAALLVLRKKANAIWGDQEEE
jgi:transposase-like protein